MKLKTMTICLFLPLMASTALAQSSLIDTENPSAVLLQPLPKIFPTYKKLPVGSKMQNVMGQVADYHREVTRLDEYRQLFDKCDAHKILYFTMISPPDTIKGKSIFDKYLSLKNEQREIEILVNRIESKLSKCLYIEDRF